MNATQRPQAAFAGAARADERAALITLMDGERAGAKLFVRPDGTRVGSLGDAGLDDVERIAPFLQDALGGERSRPVIDKEKSLCIFERRRVRLHAVAGKQRREHTVAGCVSDMKGLCHCAEIRLQAGSH